MGGGGSLFKPLCATKPVYAVRKQRIYLEIIPLKYTVNIGNEVVRESDCSYSISQIYEMIDAELPKISGGGTQIYYNVWHKFELLISAIEFSRGVISILHNLHTSDTRTLYAYLTDSIGLPNTFGIARLSGNVSLTGIDDEGRQRTTDEVSYTFAHEIGHNFGLKHNTSIDPNQPRHLIGRRNNLMFPTRVRGRFGETALYQWENMNAEIKDKLES